jgi:hypothetical protein
MAIPAPAYRAYAVTQTGLTPWLPYGPFAQRLNITVYGDFTPMFGAFVAGQVDITDWPIQPFDQDCVANPACFQNNPDFLVTSGALEASIYQLDINHHASIAGISQQENNPLFSVKGCGQGVIADCSLNEPTVSGVEFRRGLAHLIDKADFVNVASVKGRAQYVDIQAPGLAGVAPNGTTTASQFVGSAAAQAEIDKDLSELLTIAGTPADYSGITHDVSDYNLVADSIGGGSVFNGHAFSDHGYSGSWTWKGPVTTSTMQEYHWSAGLVTMLWLTGQPVLPARLI